MELPLDPHYVLSIKRWTALLRVASLRAHFSYLVRGCLPLELCGSAVVGPHELPPDVEAIWILLHSVQYVVAALGGNVLRTEENDL